jgi:putative ABC transport system permease protein
LGYAARPPNQGNLASAASEGADTVGNIEIRFMDNLVVSNVLHRKTRTVMSAAGVSLGVILVVMTVGLVHGFFNEQARRNGALTAEIIMSAPGTTFGLDLSPTLSIPIQIAGEIRGMEGVAAVVPIGRFYRGRLVDGIDYESYTRVSNMHIVRGRPVVSGDEAMIDSFLERTKHLSVGDQVEVFDRPFRIVGVYEPESLGRIKVPLSTLQGFSNASGLCSSLLVKVSDPSQQEDVAARIRERYPDHGFFLTRDLPALYAGGTPALQTFLKVVVALSIIVSTLVILLTMYTTVTERTRQIGVLKSLGATRPWIAFEIQKEAMLISLFGVLAGFAISAVGKIVLVRVTPLNIDLEPIWLLYALGLGIVSGAFGALYPAVRASGLDPVKALSYE